MTASPPIASASATPTRVRYGVLGFCGLLAMITYLDRVCFGTVAPYIQSEFDLSEQQLGMLFTAFALAYSLFEVPTGWLGDLFGARRTLIRIVLWWSAFTALTGLIYPWYGVWAFWALLTVRFLFGVGEAGAFPNISRAFASWFPATERGFAQGAVWMAGRFAGGLSPLIVLILAYEAVDSHNPEYTRVHWRHIFWIFGAIGTVWCVAFYFWFRDTPAEHASVNPAERKLIEGSAVTGHLDPGHANVPWSRLLSSVNLWLLCLMYFCASYGWYFNITWLPKYLGQVLGVSKNDIWEFSLLAGAPLLLGSLACLGGGLLTDGFIRRTGNRKWGRRLYGALGHGACAACCFLTLTAKSPWLFVFFLALAAFCNDLTMGSAWAACIDIGGKYAGIVSGCMNTIGNLGGALAGYATGWIVELYKHSPDPQMGWRINFISYGVAYLIATLLWLRFDATKSVVPRQDEDHAF